MPQADSTWRWVVVIATVAVVAWYGGRTTAPRNDAAAAAAVASTVASVQALTAQQRAQFSSLHQAVEDSSTHISALRDRVREYQAAAAQQQPKPPPPPSKSGASAEHRHSTRQSSTTGRRSQSMSVSPVHRTAQTVKTNREHSTASALAQHAESVMRSAVTCLQQEALGLMGLFPPHTVCARCSLSLAPGGRAWLQSLRNHPEVADAQRELSEWLRESKRRPEDTAALRRLVERGFTATQKAQASFSAPAVAGGAKKASDAAAHWLQSPEMIPTFTDASACPPNAAFYAGLPDSDYALCANGADWDTANFKWKGADRCVVYSFGSRGEASFEETVTAIGCEVHTFDPTLSMIGQRPPPNRPGRTFHPFGLWDIDGKLPSGTYGRKPWVWPGIDWGRGTNSNPWPMHSIRGTMETLGHKAVEILKIDVEGCEWFVFEHMLGDTDFVNSLCNGDLRISQLTFESHTFDHLSPPPAGYPLHEVAERNRRVVRLQEQLRKLGFVDWHRSRAGAGGTVSMVWTGSGCRR
eukprot:TRINITY_DN13792_c0_g1_i1.p1 TRINITY_DN13792_c0_g1~~TRINITY_DN13792_c0_g1_i1.p1  ORF type:complete len:524 (+),score=57.29 TRINITY_DN13792_c0_g1_i1:56-1627(+)